MSNRESSHTIGRVLVVCAVLLALGSTAWAGGAGSGLDQGAYYHIVMLDTSFLTPGGGDPDVTWLKNTIEALGMTEGDQWLGGPVLFGLLVPVAPSAGNPNWSWGKHVFGTSGNSTDDFGSWEDIVDVVGAAGFTSGTMDAEGVDGLGAIQTAAAEFLAFGPGSSFTHQYTLVTDGPPVSWSSGATVESVAPLFGEASLNTIIDHGFEDDTGAEAMGVFWDHGTVTSYMDGGAAALYAIHMGGGPLDDDDADILASYVDLSMRTNGSSWSIHAAEADTGAFRQGFRDVKIAEVGGRGGGGGVPEPAAGLLFLVGAGLVLIRRRMRGR